MNDRAVVKMVSQFAHQGLVLSNWLVNRTLRTRPELANSEEMRDLQKAIQELTAQVKELDND